MDFENLSASSSKKKEPNIMAEYKDNMKTSEISGTMELYDGISFWSIANDTVRECKRKQQNP